MVLFSNGYENDFADFAVYQNAGVMSIVSNPVQEGVKAAKHAYATQGYCGVLKYGGTVSGVDTLSVRASFYFDSFPNNPYGNDELRLINITNSSYAESASLSLVKHGTALRLVTADGTVINFPFPFQLGKYYYIELTFVRGVEGGYHVYLDTVEVIAQTGVDTSTTPTIMGFKIGFSSILSVDAQGIDVPFVFYSDNIKADSAYIGPDQVIVDIDGPYTANKTNPTIQFVSTVSGPSPYSYLWDFGDGTTSTDPNPSHTYPAIVQTYTVTLAVNGVLATTTASIWETAVTLTIKSSTGGKTDPPAGTYQYPVDPVQIQSVTATPDAGYLFKTWLLDGVDVGGLTNPINVTMDGDHTLQPVFESMLPSQGPQKSELRAVLVKPLAQYTHDCDLICKTLSDNGFNAVYVEANPFAWTGLAMADFQSMIDACKKYGLDFHVLLTLGIGTNVGYSDALEASYPYGFTGYRAEWCTVTDTGTLTIYPSFASQAARDRVKQVIQTMLTYFPDIVDFNLDYVRYSMDSGLNYKTPYDDASKAAFLAWLSANGKTFTGNWADYYHGGSRWTEFAEWRCIPINNIVRDIRAWALAIKPDVTITADVYTPWSVGGWTPDHYPEQMGQDPAYWISQGYIDAINPMNYVPNAADLQYRTDQEIAFWLGTAKGAIPLVPFITQGGPGNDVPSAIPIGTFIDQINYLRNTGCNGFIIWMYEGPGFVTGGFTDITPYLVAIKNNTTKGAFPAFNQTRPAIAGSTVTWQTSLPTIGKVEYSQNPIFVATPKVGSYLPYLDIDYIPGTIISESTPTTNHMITVPLAQPFYSRIRSEDSNIEIASPVYGQLEAPTYHNLTILSATGGTTNPTAGTYPYAEGSTLAVTAIPNNGYQFKNWLLDGAVITDNPIDVYMDTDHTLEPVFALLPPSTWGITILATPAEGGTTTPSGSITVNEAESLTVTATPIAGYNFARWELDQQNIGSENPITIPAQVVGSSHALLAVFSLAPKASLVLPATLSLLAVGGVLYLATRKKR
jgi:PKD repeat protein